MKRIFCYELNDGQVVCPGDVIVGEKNVGDSCVEIHMFMYTACDTFINENCVGIGTSLDESLEYRMASRGERDLYMTFLEQSGFYYNPKSKMVCVDVNTSNIKAHGDDSMIFDQPVVVIEGDVEDLLNVSQDETMVGTRLFYNIGDDAKVDDEVIDVAITSTNMTGKHPLFDKMRDKRIRVSVNVLD